VDQKHNRARSRASSTAQRAAAAEAAVPPTPTTIRPPARSRFTVSTPLGSRPHWVTSITRAVPVLHHGLADGLGGLAPLDGLINAPPAHPRSAFPGPHPPGLPSLVTVPAIGPVPDRLGQVTSQVSAHKAADRAAPDRPAGWIFRPLAVLGGHRRYMNHQRRLHALVSRVRGPAEPVTFGGSPVISAIPAGVDPGGNLPVHFEVLSCAGTLTVTAIADPDHFRELGALAAALRAEFDLMTHRPKSCRNGREV
jgi:hypothetical protein